MTSAINDDKNLCKKSKHRKEKEEVHTKIKDKEEGDGSVNELEKESRKKEKKMKEKYKSDTQKDDVILAEEDAVTSKREKKKRRRDIEINGDEADAMTMPKKKQKKTRKSDDHKSIDSKGTKSKSAKGDKEETPETTGTRKKSKKDRKNKTGFFDPEEDEETDLPEQARKALSYAFRRFHDPENWKFNKARQNWLVRNLWNFQSLPEKYEDLVVKYLSAVQGNTRENILKTCKKALDENNTSGVSDKLASAGGPIIDAPNPSNNDDQKKARAQALFKALASESAS